MLKVAFLQPTITAILIIVNSQALPTNKLKGEIKRTW